MLGPRRKGRYPDRHLDCEEALESFFLAVMELAQDVGWTPEEAAVAISSLSDHFILKRIANDEALQTIVGAKLRRRTG